MPAPDIATTKQAPLGAGAEGDLAARLARWRQRYPTLPELERPARRRLPYFAYDFLQGGTGGEQSCRRNLDALDAIEIVPRYGVDVAGIDTSVTLFGRRYAAPVAVGAVGMDGLIWPGATRALASAAEATGIPYSTGTMATADLETVGSLAPGSFWFQLYGLPGNDHAVSFDLMRRARDAGAHVLVVTLDIPVPSKRVRDMRNGITMPFRIRPQMMASTVAKPAWLVALARQGMPRFANMAAYCPPGAGHKELAEFVRRERAGAFAWDKVARIREAWQGPMVVKGILHPADATKALSLGVDGIVVSNHGGRQFDAAPAPIDVLPAIRAAVGPEVTVLMDSGVMSGLDILRAIACGADGVLAGRAFMLGLAALGPHGARHVAATFVEEFRVALGQSGALSVAGAAARAVRHPGAWSQDEFEPRDRAQAAAQPEGTAP